METAALVLLIVVSSTLAVFLVLLTVALVYSISILRRLKEIVNRAENVAVTMESAAHVFQKTASPLAIIKLLGGIINSVQRLKRKEKS